MAFLWGLAVPLPTHLSLMLLGFLVYGIWVFFSRYRSQTQEANKTEVSNQHNLNQIQKLAVSQLEETEMNIIATDLTCISGLPMGWTQEYVFWSIDRSLRQIFQHLENARSTLLELSLSESRARSPSSISDIVLQEVVPPCCYCKKGKPSDFSSSSGSSHNTSSPCYLPVLSEGKAWQFQSSSVPTSSQKEPSMPRSHDTSLPTFQLTDPEISDLQNLPVFPPLRAQSSCISSILESLDPCKQEKMKDKKKTHFLSDYVPNSILNESPGPLEWTPLQLCPSLRGDLEGHMSQKVSTLRQRVVPLPVKKSWDILSHLMDVQGAPEQELPQTQLPTLLPQSAEHSTNRSPDLPSFHLHVNIGVNSELNGTEAKLSQPLTSNAQLQSEDDCQALRYNPLVISMDTPSPRNLGVNIIPEDNALLKKDPKHLLELSIEQRVIGLPQKRIQTHKAQVTNVELTPKIPCSTTESVKVTPLALLQVMDKMGMIPESHLEMIDSVRFSPQPGNQGETVNTTPEPLNQVSESQSPQHQTMESKNMALRSNQVTDNMKVTPVALFHVMDSMGMINELHPHVTEPAGTAPKPQYQVMESAKMATLYNHQAIRPGDMSLGPQHTVMEAMEMISQPQHKVMETLNMTLGSQNQATEHIRIIPGSIHQNTMKISSSELPEAVDYTKATPVAQQTMNFMQIIPPGQPHITGSRTLIQGSKRQPETLTLVSAHPDVLTSSTVPVRTAESRTVPPQPLFKVLEPSGVTLVPSGQSLHTQKVTPIVEVSPTGMITPVQVVEPPGFILQPVTQVKESLELPSGLHFQVGDSVGMTPLHQGTEYVSLTPRLSHQVMDPLKFTSWHQDHSEVSQRQSQEMTETMGLTSDTWPQMKNSIDVTQSCHQIMESMRTIPAPPDQGTVPIEISQKHQVAEAEAVPVIPLLQEMDYFGGNTIPQPTVMDSMNLLPELQNVKSEHLIPDPRLKNKKSVDITTDLVSEIVNYEPPTSTVVPTDLAPELHQQNLQSGDLTSIPQLQSETSVPSASESQLQDVKSGQLTVEPQLQNTQSAVLAPDPQLQSNKSVYLIPGSESQGIKDVHSALSQEIQGDIKMVPLTLRPSPEDTKSCSQNISSDKIAHVLEDTMTPLVEGRSTMPDMLEENMKDDELIPSTQLDAVKSLEVNPSQSYHFLEPEGLSLQHQAAEPRVTSDTHQADDSELAPSSGITPIPWSQTSESVAMSLPPLQDTLETRTQIGKEIEESLESQNKDTLNLLTESEVQDMITGVMAPETQPSNVKFVHMTLEPCSEITSPSEKTLRPEYEDTEIRLALPKIDDAPETIAEPYSEMRSLELSLESGVQGEKSESLAQNLKSVEVITESSVLVVEPTELTAGPKLYINDVISEPQPHEVKSRRMDTESQLQNEKSVNVIQQIPIGEVDPERTKPDPGLQSLPLKDMTEGTQPPDVKPVDLNIDPQQLSVQSGLISGPQLQSVEFPRLYQEILQGENPVNFISGPPHYDVKSDEAISCSPAPEIRSSDFIPGPKLPEPQPQPQHVKPVEVSIGPCLQDVRFSDLISEPKHQNFKYTQFIPGVQLQDGQSQGFIPEPFLPLSQESQVEDRALLLPTEVPEFHSMEFPIPASELQYPSMIPEEVNPGVWQQDTKFSDLASGPKLQGVKFGEQTPGLLFPGMSTPELGTHDPKSAKMTPGLQNTRQVSFKSGPRLQDVIFFDVIPGAPPQGVETSELNLESQLEGVKISELTTQPERQGMKPESLLQDIKYVTGNQAPGFEDRMSYKLTSEPQIPNAESMTLTPEIHLASVHHSELTRRPQAQGTASSELTHGQHLGYIKLKEKITAPKQAELTPGPHLGDMKFMGLMSKSELGKVKSTLSSSGIHAGGKKLGELSLGSNLKGLKSELLASRPQLEDKKSVVLTLGQCLERIKSTVVSPSSSQLEGTKSVKLIPGSRIQDLTTMGLVHDIHSQDVNTMGLKLEPKKQGEGPVKAVPGMLLYDKSMRVLQGPQLKVIKPKELTSQPQMQDRKHVIVSCWKQQNLKPIDIDKTQGTQKAKFVDLVSTQQYQEITPMDLSLEPGQDDQITVNSPEWKDEAFDQLNKQLESEDTLSMRSDQEPKPADIKPIEINYGVQFQDTPSLDLAPEPVHNVKANEFQYEPLMPSLKPCQVTPRSQVHQIEALKPPTPDVRTMPLNTEPQMGSTKSVQWIPISEFQSEKCIGSNFRLHPQSGRPTDLKLCKQWRGMRSSELTAKSKIQGEKPVGFHFEPQLQKAKTSPLVLGLQKTKTFNLPSASQPQGIKTIELNRDPQVGSVRSIQRVPGPEFHGVKFLGLNCRPLSQGVKSTEQKPSTQLGGVKTSEMSLGPKLPGEKSVDFNLEPQVHCMKTLELSPEPDLQKGENTESPSEPQPQDIKSVELNSKPQVGSVRYIQWVPGPEFHGVKFLGLNCRPLSQGVRSIEWKPSTQLGGVKTSEMSLGPKLPGEKSVDFNLEPQVQYIKNPKLSPEPDLQKGENIESPSEPQPQDIKSVELNSEPQVGSVRSIQWVPGPEFHGVKFLGLNWRSLSQGVKSTERKPSTQLGGVKTSEMSLGPKLPGEKSVDFNLGPQVQCIKTPATSPGPELQKGENFASTSEPQSQCVKSMTLHHGPQLENTKSVQRTPVSDYQAKKTMLNLRPQSQDVTAKELKPLVQLRNVKISDEVPTRSKLQGKQPSGSTQEHHSHRFKTTDSKSELQVRNMKACDPTLRSKINNIKLTFKPRFHLEDTHSPVLNPGIQSQEVKPSGSPSGTEPQALTSLLFKQDSESSKAKYGVLSQQPQLQNNIVLESEKSSELILETKPRGMKSKINSGPQWQRAKCSDLTPEKESQNMKCTKLSPSSQLKGKPFSELAMGTKIQSVKIDYKPRPKWQGLKSNSVLRTKPQEMEDCESCPQLQDLESSRTIMGIKVQDVKSMDFGPGLHLQGMASEEVTEKRVHGVKSVKAKPSSKLQGKKPDFTQRKMLLGTKVVELNSGSPLQDMKYPELNMGMKLQGMNSMRQHPTGIKSSETVTQIKFQDVKARDFHSGPQTQNKKPYELIQGKRLQDMESTEFNQGPKLQGVTMESKPPNEESVKLNSGPQLQDENYSKSVLETKLPDGRRSMVVSSGLCLQGMKPSEVIAEDMLQKEKLVSSVDQPLWQDVKSKWTFCKAHARRPLQMETLQVQDSKLSMLTPELHLLKSEAINPGSKMKGVKSEPTNVLTRKNMGSNHGVELQAVGLSEQASDSTIYSVFSSELNAGNQRQDGKAHKLSQKQQLQSIKPTVFSYEPHLQHIKSPVLCTKLQDVKTVKFNSEQQFQDVKSSELGLETSMRSLEFNPGSQMQEIKPDICTETKVLNESSLEFKHEPRLQGRAPCCPSLEPQIHCKNVMASNTNTQNVELSELYPDLDFQSIKSKVLCIGPHLEDVNSACTSNSNSQYINSSGCKPEPYLQDINSSACTPEPDPQCINSMCSPGPHWHGMNSSACILGSKSQYVDSTGCNYEPNLKDANSSVCTPEPTNSSVCTPGPSPQCANSVCTSGPSPQCVNSSVCTSGPSSLCVNSSVCTPGPSPQCVNSSVCTPGPSPQCVNSSVCTPGPSPQCVNSSVCTPGPSPPHANSTECNSEAHLQDVTQWTSILGPQIQCVDSPGCNPKSHLQGVNSSACTLEQNSQCEHSNRYNLGPLPQDKNSYTFPAPQIMCVNSLWCDTKTHLQDVHSSARTLRQESQFVNSTGYNHEPHLQAPKLQGMKFSELNPRTEIQREIPIIVDPGQHLQELNLELTPGSNIIGVVPVEYNPGVNFSELNSDLKSQYINSVKLSSEPRLQNMKSFELASGSESQCTKSVLLNSEPPFQDMKSSDLMGGTNFQEIPFLMNQLGSWQQTAQPMFTLRPQSGGMESMGVLPTPLTEERMSPEMSKQPLLCTNSVKLTPGCGLQDLRSKEFSPEPCFQKDRSVPLKPGSQSHSVNYSEFTPWHSSQCATPEPCFQDIKSIQLRLGSQQRSMNYQQLPLDEKPVTSTPGPTSKFLAGPALTSVKFSNLISESQQQCMKSTEFTAEPKWQNEKHVTLPSVSFPQTGNSVELSPRPFLQNVTHGNQIPQTSDQITEFSNVLYRPGHQLVNYPEMNTKMSHQFSNLVNFISLPVYQDVGSSEMAKGLGHKSTETMEKSMRLTPTPTDEVIETVGMPLQLDLQVPEFVDLNPTLCDPDSKSSELTPQQNYQIPETLELLSCLWPQFKDFKELQTKARGSDGVIFDLKNHVAEMVRLTYEAQKKKAFSRVASKSANRATGCVEKSPRPCPQDLEPVVVSSEKRSQREQSVVSPPKPFYHVPDSASGITPGQGPQSPESVSLTTKPWLQIEQSLELSTQQTSQVVGNIDSVELPFEIWQPGDVAGRLTKNRSIENSNITPIESLDQIINSLKINPKPQDPMTESAKTQLQVSQSVAFPKISESVEVIPGPPLQVIESMMIPEPTSEVSKYTFPKLHDVIFSEYAPSLWLQNVQSKKLIAQPTHQILETIELTGFQVIKTILVPKPLLLIVNSEELAPGPSPQAIEPIGITTRSSFQVKGCLNLLPRLHLQDMVKPVEQAPGTHIQEDFAELILQQTSPLEESPVFIQEQRLQAENSLGIKTESPKAMRIEDLNQEWVCQNRDSEMITSEKLQAENYFSRFIHSPSFPFISSSVKTELGPLQGSGMPEVSRALAMQKFGVDILHSPESYKDTIMIRSSALPMVLPSDKTGNTVGTLYPEIWEVGVISKEATEKKQMEEFENSLHSYPPYSLRLLPSEFQAGLGARRNPMRPFLGRQQNVWESHVCRQRLPRKYLSNMLMLGNVLGTTMERKICSEPFLTEGATMDICQSIQNLFGVPAELMEFSQSLLERGPRTISQTSVVKNYIQRHILCHGHEKRMPLKMWTRGSTSSIIQQYSGTRLGIKKTNSKLSDMLQEYATQHMPVSCIGAQLPALIKPESSLGMLYNREDPVPGEQSKNSQSNSPTRTIESHHSLKASYLCQAKTAISEQLHMLKDLQLQIAAKLLRSQIPHNVPPPLASGLVLKYPICLQCGRCSGFNCCHKIQSAFGPYLLIYPQLHLLSTPEGHGEIRLHLGFRLRTGKRSQVSKYRGRSRTERWKSTAPPSRRKPKSPGPKSSTSTRPFQPTSPQSPTSLPVHIRQKQWGNNHGVVGKTVSEHYEFCHVHSLSESGFESNQDEKWAKSSLRKTSDLKYPMKKIIKGLKTQNIKLYQHSRSTEESPGMLMGHSRSKSIDTTQINSFSLKRQPKKSSQPKFIQLLFQGLRQAFQTAHKIVAIARQKPGDGARIDSLWSRRNLHPRQKSKDYCLAGDSKETSSPLIQPRLTGSIPQQEDKFEGIIGNQYRQTQQLKQVSGLQPSPLQLQNTMVATEPSSLIPMSLFQNISGRTKNNYSDEISSPEPKNGSKVGAKFQVQERKILQSHFKDAHKEEKHDFFRERAVCNKPSERTYRSLSVRTQYRRRHRSPSQRKHSSPSDRTLRTLSEKSHHSPERKDHSPSVRTLQSFSDKSHYNLFKGRGRSPSGRRLPSPVRSPHSPSGRRAGSPADRRGHNPSPNAGLRRGHHSPPPQRYRSPSPQRYHSSSPQRYRSPSPQRYRSPSPQRYHSPSKRSHLSAIRRTRVSPSEKSHGSFSERIPSRPSGKKKYSSSGRAHHSPSRSRLHLIHTERTHYSVSESRHSHSERSHPSHSEKSQPSHDDSPHHRPKEGLRHGFPKERPGCGLSKEFKIYLSMPPTDHTKNSKSWTSLEA